jgi:hypothetical protein
LVLCLAARLRGPTAVIDDNITFARSS